MMNSLAPEENGTFAALTEIRSHFPALNRLHNGRPIAYFDGPGGTQVPHAVVEAMSSYLFQHNANTHWAFPTSVETDQIIWDARAAVADFLNATPDEIAFGANMTTLTFHLARALGRTFAHGDEIVVTELEHHANVAPWRTLTEERGVRVRVAKMIPETGELDWTDFEKQLNASTKLVAIGAASNALGTITDVRRAARFAHSLGAQIFVDAVHYASHALVDVKDFDCDFLACSAYKFYGPHIGVLFGKRDRLAALDFPKLLPAPDTAPEKAETGTQNHEGIAGTAAVINFLASFARDGSRRDRLRAVFDRLHTRTGKLLSTIWNELEAISGVSVYGPRPSAARTPTIAFTVDGLQSVEVAKSLANCGIFVSHGDFYATTAVARLNQAREGLVRAGCACYTTPDEANRLIEEVRRIASPGTSA